LSANEFEDCVRFSSGVFSRPSINLVFAFVAAGIAFGISNALAQQPQSPSTALTLLARASCETGTPLDGIVDLDTGYIAMLGVGEKAYSLRVLRDGVRVLMIPAVHCGDLRALESRPFMLILSHSFQNQQRVREGYYYLMNEHGQLMNAIHFQDGRSHRFAFANPDNPVRRADFEAEKDIWISKIAESAALRRVGRDAD
jgi:hypothetical protein